MQSEKYAYEMEEETQPILVQEPIQNPNTKKSDDNRYDEILEHMYKCCLCGQELKYHHETDYVMLTVREEAHCDSCGIRTKREAFTIQ